MDAGAKRDDGAGAGSERRALSTGRCGMGYPDEYAGVGGATQRPRPAYPERSMGKPRTSQRHGLGCGWIPSRALVCAMVFGLGLGTGLGTGWGAVVHDGPVQAAARRHAAPLTPWEQAERARDAFEGAPAGMHTRADFTAVMDRYRLIYHENPRAPYAPEAINTVAELLAEAGRELHDPRSFQAALGQYEFLRTQYPGSPLRVGALLAEAQIDANDLHAPAAAHERYQLFLEMYPRSSLAEQARAGDGALAESAAGRGGTVAGSRKATASGQESRVLVPESAGQVAQPAVAPAAGSSAVADRQHGANGMVGLPAPMATVYHRGPLAPVSGIRHWSTPTYTRVAIDLGGEVEYEAARVPSPDRIFFDLHGAKLSPELVGKSFAVTDGGFLKRIRAAQSSPDVTRVVLDVNDVTEYSAFLLPNPYRLIIDIHGRSKAAGPMTTTSVDAPAAHAATVPNTRAMRASSPAEVDGLSEQPGKVEATPAPTSQPMATTVAGRTQATSPTGAGDGSAVARAPVVREPAAMEQASAGLPAFGTTGVAASRGTGNGAATAADGAVVGVPYTLAPVPARARPATAGRRAGRRDKVLPSDALVVGDPATPARAASKTADGETSLVRALGLKINRIVIDAGHGGHDSGTIGVGGLEEKDVVLDVALRLGKLLHDKLGADVIYTRADDTFIPLETRTAIANKAQADLFISIHANSSDEPSARGVETYYLNFTQQADALEVAARENAVSGQSIHQLSDLVRKITLKDKLAESREFATDVEGSLYGGLARGNDGLKDRGVKKAPFVVLIGANMPSILAEISFLTNPRDAAELRQPEYKERVAESLYRGIARYIGSLSSTAPASAATERASAGR